MKFTSFIFFIFPLLLSAQDTVITKNKGSIDIVSGIDYSNLYNNYEGSSPNGLLRLNQWTYSNGGLGWRIGIYDNIRIDRDWVFKIGLNVAKHKLQINTDFNYEENSSIEFWFLDLPVVFRREMEVRKLSPYIEFGIAPTMFLKSNIELEGGWSSLEVYEDIMNKFDFVLIFAGGFNYKLNKEWDAFFQPTYRYHMRGVETYPDSKEHFYTLGIEFGLRGLY